MRVDAGCLFLVGDAQLHVDNLFLMKRYYFFETLRFSLQRPPICDVIN